MASISFSPDKMEFLILFTSGDISEDKQKETLNLGQAQILMDISPREKGSLMAIKVLLPTPLGEEAMNVVKKLAEKSELKSLLINKSFTKILQSGYNVQVYLNMKTTSSLRITNKLPERKDHNWRKY